MWEQNVPSVGTKRSQGGNEMFPRWEQAMSRKLNANRWEADCQSLGSGLQDLALKQRARASKKK